MTLDLSRAKVGDKVRHRNGGVSVVEDLNLGSGPKVRAGGAWYPANGLYAFQKESGIDIVELIQQEDELKKSAEELAKLIGGELYGKPKDLLLNFANARIKAARER